MGEIIVIASQKGGVGKTTTAINLGTSLAILGKRTLIIDLDSQGSIAAGFQLDEISIAHGLFNVVVKKAPLALAITDIGLDNLEIVPSNVHNEEEEIDLYTHALQFTLLRSILKPVKDEYDYILLDCPPNLGTLTINGIVAADSILIPVQCEYYSLQALGKFLRSVKTLGLKYNPDLKFCGILVTMYDQRLKKNREILNELRYGFKDILFNTIIPRNSKISEAPGYGKPVALIDVSSPGAINYFKLAEELLSKDHRI